MVAGDGDRRNGRNSGNGFRNPSPWQRCGSAVASRSVSGSVRLLHGGDGEVRRIVAGQRRVVTISVARQGGNVSSLHEDLRRRTPVAMGSKSTSTMADVSAATGWATTVARQTAGAGDDDCGQRAARGRQFSPPDQQP
ncbi:hypothetical protein ACLOJK_000348 [Asimina triloba]